MWLTALWWSKRRKWHHVTTAHDLQQVLGDGAMPLWALPLSAVMSSTDFINKAAKEIKHKLDLICKTDLWSCFKTVNRLKRQRDFLEVSLGRRGEQWEAEHETPPNSPLLVFFLFPFPPLHPTPPLSARLLPHPILLTPLLLHCSQPQTLAFCIKGANPMNNPVRLSQNKLVGEGSRSKPERLEQRGAQPPPPHLGL